MLDGSQHIRRGKLNLVDLVNNFDVFLYHFHDMMI